MRRAARSAALLLTLLGIASGAAAAVSSQQTGALLVFPLVVVSDDGATDTVIQLTNVDAAARRISCAFEDPSAGPAFTSFAVDLLANQPIAWRASQGLAAVPGGGGAIPGLGNDAFTGALRCHAVDAAGAPSDSNAFVGLATLVHGPGGAEAADAAGYAASAFAAAPGAVNGDAQLVLGGTNAEYDACPQAVIVPALLDGASVALGAAGLLSREVNTTLAVIPCGVRATGSTDSAVVITLVNEFGQLSSFVSTVRDQLVTPLTALDNRAASVFRAATQGSLSGTIRITPQAGSAGVLALAVQRFTDAGNGANPHSATLEPQLAGERGGDIVEVPPIPAACAGDCNGDGRVVINELITGVNIALNRQPVSACPAFDSDRDGTVKVNELIAAVGHALRGC